MPLGAWATSTMVHMAIPTKPGGKGRVAIALGKWWTIENCT